MWIEASLIALLGIFVGGALNVLADTLPHYKLPQTPQYPDGTARPVSAWLGISAFLLGKRQSPAGAGSRLSWRYPLTEIATALAFFVTVARVPYLNTQDPNTYVNTLQLIFWLYYIAMLVLVIVIDVEHYLILFVVVIPSAVIALIDATLTPAAPPYAAWAASAAPTLSNALIGAGLGFGVFFLFYAGGFLYTKISSAMRGIEIEEVAFGYGDVMLVTLAGLILGWQALLVMMFLTVFLGAGGALIFLIAQRLRRKAGSLLTPLPYGPYIAVSMFIMLVYSDVIREFVLTTYY